MCDKNFYLSMDEKQIHDDDSEDEDMPMMVMETIIVSW